MRAVVITLVKDNPTAHEVFSPAAQVQREVFAELRSVGMNESYQAKSQGLNPELKFVLTLAEDYDDEHIVLYNSVQYKVLRTYMNGDGIELTVGRDADV